MVRQDLINYIKKELAAGYPISQLRDYLLSQGYSQRQVDEAIDSLYEKPKPQKLKLPEMKLLPVIALFVVLVLFIAGFFILKSFLAQGPETISLPGSNVSQVVIGGENETTPTETKPITETKPPARTTQTTTTSTQVTQTQTGITLAVALERIDSMSLPDSKTLCNQFSTAEKDRCLRKVALSHDDSSSCEGVKDVKIRDDCYFNFAYLEEFSVCEKIEDVYLQQSCRDLGKVQTYTFPENQTNEI